MGKPEDNEQDKRATSSECKPVNLVRKSVRKSRHNDHSCQDEEQKDKTDLSSIRQHLKKALVCERCGNSIEAGRDIYSCARHNHITCGDCIPEGKRSITCCLLNVLFHDIPINNIASLLLSQTLTSAHRGTRFCKECPAEDTSRVVRLLAVKALHSAADSPDHTYDAFRATAESALRCPVCLDVPVEYDILLCPNGHGVCRRCDARLGVRCPVCREDYDMGERHIDAIGVRIISQLGFGHDCGNVDCTARFADEDEAMGHPSSGDCPMLDVLFAELSL